MPLPPKAFAVCGAFAIPNSSCPALIGGMYCAVLATGCGRLCDGCRDLACCAALRGAERDGLRLRGRRDAEGSQSDGQERYQAFHGEGPWIDDRHPL
jgi:hypothetical protein